MIKTAIIAAVLSQLAFGAFFDCEHYAEAADYTDAVCTADTACYIDPEFDVCRANCTKITFMLPIRDGDCDAMGCEADSTNTLVVENYEGDIPCSPTSITAAPTSETPSPTISTGEPTPAPTDMPTVTDETAAPTEATNPPSAETGSPTASPVTPAPTAVTEPPTTTTTKTNSGDGRCKADGTVQEQIFGPQEYKCGDYNLGQPEQRCLYIDASSSCVPSAEPVFNECGTEDNAWPTFQSALDSLNGETVVLIVKAGTYSGEGNINIRSPNLESLNEYVFLNIFSESGSDDTIIDCKGEGFGFHLYQTTIRLDGFTIINCVAEERDTFSLPSYATNDYIKSAPDTGRLGGALFLDRTFIEMNDMIIVNNGGEYGGAIFQYQNSIRMNNSIVEYNCATNSGGGIFLLFANLYVWNSYVLCNEADVFGGGIFGHQQRTDILTKSLVDENVAAYGDELFVDRTTVNVDTEDGGMVSDNDVPSWNLNEVTYCPLDNNAAYNLDRSLNFCSRSDSSMVDASSLSTGDEGSCEVELVSPAPTVTGATKTPTTDDEIVAASDANCYKLFAVTLVTMVISFIV